MGPPLPFLEWMDGGVPSSSGPLLARLRADFTQSKQRLRPQGTTRAGRRAWSQGGGPARGAVVMETVGLRAPNCNSQRPPQLPVGKMVARRRKRGAQGSEQGIPSPPGYSAIPIKFSEKQQASHYLYVREHRVREGTKSSWPQKRTLFVLNVPPYCTEECLARLLSPCGPVQSVELQEKPDLADRSEEPKSKFFHPTPVRGFQVAYVVFQKPGAVSAALALKGPLLVSTDSHPVKSGVHKWVSNYTDSVPDPEALRVEVDTFMEAYDKRIAEEEAKAKEEEGIPDEEGWVKVTRRGRRPVLPRTEAASLRVLERERRKRARKELLNFYAWQHRETKMEHLAQLRKKFEEDKQRIGLMRAQRKFRPY